MKTSRAFRITVFAIVTVSGLGLAWIEWQRVAPHSKGLPAQLMVSQTATPHVRSPDVATPPDSTPLPTSPHSLSSDAPLIAPCAEPLRVSIGTVDPEFNVPRKELERALRDAASEWNVATGRRWFVVVPSGGIAVNLLFDGRQAELEELSTTERALDEEIQQLKQEQETRTNESMEIEHLIASASQTNARYEGLVTAYNADLAQAQARGGINQASQAAFATRREGLDALRAQAEASANQVKLQVEQYNQRARETQRKSEELQSKINDVKKRFPPRLIREAEHRKGALVNEINVYTFTDSRELHHTLLHELGHALGLSHASEPGTVMSPIREIGGAAHTLTPSDKAAARLLCGDEP